MKGIIVELENKHLIGGSIMAIGMMLALFALGYKLGIRVQYADMVHNCVCNFW